MNTKGMLHILKGMDFGVDSHEDLLPYSPATRLILFPWGLMTVEAPMHAPGCHIAKGDPVGPMFWYVSPDSRLMYPEEPWTHEGEEHLVIFSRDNKGSFHQFGVGVLEVMKKRPHYTRQRIKVEIYPHDSTAKHEINLSSLDGLVAVLDTNGIDVHIKKGCKKETWKFKYEGRNVEFRVTNLGYLWKVTGETQDKQKVSARGKSKSFSQMVKAISGVNLQELTKFKQSLENRRKGYEE